MKGRFWKPNWIVDEGVLATMSGAEHKTLDVLSRHANRHGVARPSQKTIAKCSGLSIRGVQYALSSLARKGLIGIVFKGHGRGKCSEYKLLFQNWLQFHKAERDAKKQALKAVGSQAVTPPPPKARPQSNLPTPQMKPATGHQKKSAAQQQKELMEHLKKTEGLNG